MKPEDVNNRKDAILYFLQILKEKNGPIDLGEFFLNSGYTRGIESFEKMMEEMESKGWIIINKTPSGSVSGMPYLKTNKVTYEISLDGLEYFERNTNGKHKYLKNRFIKKISIELKKGLNLIMIGIIVTVIGGLILQSIISSNAKETKRPHTNFEAPLFQLEKYKIKADNKEYPTLDTLKIKIQYQGSKIVVNDDFEISNYTFKKSYLFFKDKQYNDKPELSLLEVINTKPIVDSLNPISEVILEIKRRMILDGNYMAWFDKVDKQIIGEISIAYSYKMNYETINDTLNTEIYLEK